MRLLTSLLVAPLLLGLGGCTEPAPKGPLRVALVGAEPRLAPVGRDAPDSAHALLLASAAQGLVGFDASGQIEPGLAERWIISDDGLSYIFRLRRAEWRPGVAVTSREVARMLRAAMSPDGDNRLARLFAAVDEIEALTDSVIEIRLRSPRPAFLALLAAPELALIRRGAGTGPLRPAREGAWTRLDPVGDPLAPEAAPAMGSVLMTAGRAAQGLARYRERRVEAVLGGTLADLPVARAAGIAAAQLRFDPTVGLFGLAVSAREGFLASADNRDALAMAIDRDALVALFGVPGWRAQTSIVPARLDLAGPPAQPEWTTVTLPERRAIARARVEAWRANNTAPPRVTIALPEGPGTRLLFTALMLDLRDVGIEAVRAAPGTRGDLLLIDAIAPNHSASWYLTRLSCAAGLPCGETGERALAASRISATLAERGALLQAADAAFVVNAPYIALATPVRWSAVRPRLSGFRPNPRAVHPLHHLLRE